MVTTRSLKRARRRKTIQLLHNFAEAAKSLADVSGINNSLLHFSEAVTESAAIWERAITRSAFNFGPELELKGMVTSKQDELEQLRNSVTNFIEDSFDKVGRALDSVRRNLSTSHYQISRASSGSCAESSSEDE